MRQIYVHAPCKDKKSSATSTSKGGGVKSILAAFLPENLYKTHFLERRQFF